MEVGKVNYEEVRATQECLLELAIDVDKLCRKYNIPYFITSGTTLGAVRNEKFIPWDDDLDLCFFPEDLKRIRELIKSELLPSKPHYLLYNDHRPSNFCEFLADTRYVWDGLYPAKIDLLLVKSIPNTPEAIAFDQDMTNMLAFLYNRTEELNVSNQQLIQEALIDGGFWMRRERFMDRYHQYVFDTTKLDPTYLFHLDYGNIFVPSMKTYFIYSDLLPVGNIQLEGHLFMCPNDNPAFLTRLFGPTFMTPPPVEKRMQVHQGFRKNPLPGASKLLISVLYKLKAVKNSFANISRVKKVLSKKVN